MSKIVHRFIYGASSIDESDNEYKLVMLSVHYALIALVVIIGYTVIELYNDATESMGLYAAGFIIISTALFLHKIRQHTLANFILFPTYNIVVYLIASSESISTGALIFFLPVALGSSAIFNYTKKEVALGFGAISFILCLLSLTGYSILPFREYSEEDMKLSFTINFFVAFPVSMMAIYLLIRMSHHSDTKLVHSNSQMKKLNEELDRFVYSTSHDLRAPLLSLLGLLRLAENAKPEEAAQYHRMMHHRVQNLDKFIKDITDYSRNNRLMVVSEKVNPYLLVLEIWESLRYSTDAQGIELINEIPEDFIFINDNARLRVILSNLIANAISYHDQYKDHRYIRISIDHNEKAITLKVEDNGQGISAEYQTKVFEMFFRGNESSQGSGLGLYIVKETLSKLSASISLTSTPMEGSTFQISLPC